jgi:hypothetical protein
MERNRNENGFAAIGVIAILAPLLFLVSTYLQTMTGRNNRLQMDYQEERALLAAESGIDVAIYEARRGTLVAGPHAVFTFTGALPSGDSYEAIATYLGADGKDNDGDHLIDEPDEDVFRVDCTGTSGGHRRRVATYLGFSSFITAPQGAATLVNQNPNIQIGGAARVDGRNYTTAGGLVGAGNMPGMLIADPGTAANLLATMSPGEQNKVVGATPTPSLGSTNSYDQAKVNELVVQAHNAAQVVLTNPVVASNKTYGTVAGPQYVVYREGDIRIQGTINGAGLLVVNGNLTITGTMNWYGVVVVTGRLICSAGTAALYGGLVLGGAGDDFDLRGTADVRYSSQAIDLALRLTGRYVAFNGWQELSIYP